MKVATETILYMEEAMFYDYLLQTFGKNEPIFVSDISYDGMTENNIRQQLLYCVSSGKLRRYDTGIYYIPEESIFKSGSLLSQNSVIEKKYLLSDNERFGYISGINFANMIGITSQVPASCEVVTNKASKEYRETRLASAKIILRKPRVEINGDNYKSLQFLDLLKDIDLYSEFEGKELNEKIKSYMNKSGIKFSDLEGFLSLYPDKIYRNMYKVGVLNGISA